MYHPKMYPCEKEEKYNKSRKNQEKIMPSFSSTLLDEIYRSIDGVGNPEDFNAYREKPVKKQNGNRAAKTNIVVENEETRNFRRACLVEKWMEKDKNVPKKKSPNFELDNKSSLQENNDVMFLSSASSSNSDSSGALSSPETEFSGPQTKPKVSCFATRPKPVRTAPPARGNKSNQQEDFSLFGEYQNNEKNKSRALRLYANLKKMKQPISPGGRLTSFINSLFNGSANGLKKSKNIDTSKGFQDSSQSACSSATSFSRSCLSKYSNESREKLRDGLQRTVRFHPVSVIVDEDLRPCGQRRVYEEEDSDKCGKPKPPLPIREQILADLKMRKMEKENMKVEEGVRDDLEGYNSKIRNDHQSVFRKIDGGEKNMKVEEGGALKGYNSKSRNDHHSVFRKIDSGDYEGKIDGGEKNTKVEEGGALKGYNSKSRNDHHSVFRKIDSGDYEGKIDGGDVEEDNDGMSDSSSDLFELDHLSLFGGNRFCEELPVYETTRLDTNRAIASRLIR